MKIIVNSTSQTLQQLLSAEDYGIVAGYEGKGGFLLRNGANRVYLETGKGATSGDSFFIEANTTISINISSELLDTNFVTQVGESEIRLLATTGTSQYNETAEIGPTQIANTEGDTINPATEETLATLKDLTVVLTQLNRNIARPTYLNGVTGALRAIVESGSIAITSGTITALTNVNGMSGYTTTDQVWAISRASFASNVISNIP